MPCSPKSLAPVYVDPFAHSWLGFSTTDAETAEHLYSISKALSLHAFYLAANATKYIFSAPAAESAEAHSAAVLPVV